MNPRILFGIFFLALACRLPATPRPSSSLDFASRFEAGRAPSLDTLPESISGRLQLRALGEKLYPAVLMQGKGGLGWGGNSSLRIVAMKEPDLPPHAYDSLTSRDLRRLRKKFRREKKLASEIHFGSSGWTWTARSYPEDPPEKAFEFELRHSGRGWILRISRDGSTWGYAYFDREPVRE